METTLSPGDARSARKPTAASFLRSDEPSRSGLGMPPWDGPLSKNPISMKSTTKTLVPSLVLILMAAARADLLVNENFTGYTGENLVGNAATGAGLTGNWTGSGFFKNQQTSLTMAGVASSGGSLILNQITTQGKFATAAFNTPLPTTTLYGSYLFTTTIAQSNGRTVGGIGVGEASDNDTTASFAWSANGYNNVDGVEGPNVRVEGEGTPLPDLDFTFVSGRTYIFLFEFNGEAAATSAWVLNEDQLAHFYGSLDAATLNAVPTDTEAPNAVVWRGTVSSFTVGPMTNLHLFGYTPNAAGNIVFEWDEIRISDASLLEAARGVQTTPSTVRVLDVSGGPGGFTITYDAGGANVTIERSSPGLDDFQPIATGENSGAFIDTNAPQGKAFYRLEIAD